MILFHVGQKVVCVCGLDPILTKGSIYTIAALRPSTDHIYVWEAKHSVPIAWLSYRFRPVQERKTDISIFTAMLNKSPERVS